MTEYSVQGQVIQEVFDSKIGPLLDGQRGRSAQYPRMTILASYSGAGKTTLVKHWKQGKTWDQIAGKNPVFITIDDYYNHHPHYETAWSANRLQAPPRLGPVMRAWRLMALGHCIKQRWPIFLEIGSIGGRAAINDLYRPAAQAGYDVHGHILTASAGHSRTGVIERFAAQLDGNDPAHARWVPNSGTKAVATIRKELSGFSEVCRQMTVWKTTGQKLAQWPCRGVRRKDLVRYLDPGKTMFSVEERCGPARVALKKRLVHALPVLKREAQTHADVVPAVREAEALLRLVTLPKREKSLRRRPKYKMRHAL